MTVVFFFGFGRCMVPPSMATEPVADEVVDTARRQEIPTPTSGSFFDGIDDHGANRNPETAKLETVAMVMMAVLIKEQ